MYIVVFYARLIRPEGYGHLSTSAIQFDQWYRLLPRAMEESDGDCSDVEIRATKNAERMKAVLEANDVPVQYT